MVRKQVAWAASLVLGSLAPGAFLVPAGAAAATVEIGT